MTGQSLSASSVARPADGAIAGEATRRILNAADYAPSWNRISAGLAAFGLMLALLVATLLMTAPIYGGWLSGGA